MIILVKYCISSKKKWVIQGKGGIKYTYQTDAAKGGVVGQLLTLADEGGRGGQENAEICWQMGEGRLDPPMFGWSNLWTAT